MPGITVTIWNVDAAADTFVSLSTAIVEGWNLTADAAEEVAADFKLWQASLKPGTKANGIRTYVKVVNDAWSTDTDFNAVRRAIVVANADDKLVKEYLAKASDPTLRGCAEHIDAAGKPVTPPVKLTKAQKVVVAEKAAAVKAILAGLDKAVVKAILAEVK